MVSNIGWAFIVVIITNALINMSLILYDYVLNIIKAYKHIKAKFKQI
jgi:uncharacterized membrane protein YedE/YeeE